MIFMIHHRGKQVMEVSKDSEALAFKSRQPAQVLLELAEVYPDEILVWCEAQFEEGIKAINWSAVVRNKLIIASYCCSGKVLMPEEIGYVDASAFVNVNYNVPYPTWMMSGDRGAIYAETLLKFKGTGISERNFDYYLSSLAKTGMPYGLLAYSDPHFAFNNKIPQIKRHTNNRFLYNFVKDHYKKRWLGLLFIQQVIYQKKFPVLSFFRSFFRKKITKPKPLPILNSNKNNNSNNNKYPVDVLIPTIGRAKYLYQVLNDLREQSCLPHKVIVVEQNPLLDAKSELDYLHEEAWPFEIKHIFTHKTGACRARNMGMKELNSEWTFLADDDIRIPKTFLEEAQDFIETCKVQAFTVSCLQEGEEEPINNIVQWRGFGSGCSLVKSSCLDGLRFDPAYEGGFGEDADFGMQLRNKGVDVLYNPFLKLSHLKAPVGGFRFKVAMPWEKEAVQPKPSPTVMVYQIKNTTERQQTGFKTLLFLKFFRRQRDKNPFSYLKTMQKRWKSSRNWAQTLITENQ